MKPSEYFRREIKRKREIALESQEDVGKGVGISYSHVHCLENNKRQPSLDIVVRFAKHFKCSVEDLIGLGKVEVEV